MRRNKYYSYSFRSKPRLSLRNTLLIVLVGIPLSLLLAELLCRSVVFITGNTKLFSAPTEVSITQAYKLKLQEPQKSTSNHAVTAEQVLVQPVPLVGYELVPNQTSKFWQVNPQGFRDDRSVSETKAADEIRIFLMGNSTAFGQLSPSNQEILSVKLEKLLNTRLQEQNQFPAKFKPKVLPFYADQVELIANLPPRIREGKYRVITAATPSYTSDNELALLVHSVMAFRPDVMVVLDGYEDLRSPSDKTVAGISKLTQLQNEQSKSNSRLPVVSTLNDWLDSLYLVKAWQRWVVPVQQKSIADFAANQFPDNTDELKQRVKRYRYNLSQMARLTNGIPTIVAIQPEITGKASSLSPEESDQLKALGDDYRDRVKNAYAQLDVKALSSDLASQKLQVKFVDLYRLYENFSGQAFYDPIHLTDAGNNLLADRLAKTIAEVLAVQPKPPDESSYPQEF